MTEQRKPPTYVDYRDTVSKIFDLLGVGKETQTSVAEIAETIGVGHSPVQTIKSVLSYVGAIKTRYTQSGGGKRTWWTLTCDRDEALRRVFDSGLDFSMFTTEHISKETLRHNGGSRVEGWSAWPDKVKPAPRLSAKGGHPNAPAITLPPRAQAKGVEVRKPPMTEPRERPMVAIGTDAKGLQTAIAGTDPVSPLSGLRVLKRNEAAALVAAAIQYRDRIAFVEEQRKAFADRGITLNADALGLTHDDRLETLGLVLEYVEELKRQNDRMASILGDGKMEAEIRELRRKEESHAHQIERLVREKNDMIAAHTAEVAKIRNGAREEREDFERKLGAKSVEIRDLGQKLADANNRIRALEAGKELDANRPKTVTEPNGARVQFPSTPIVRPTILGPQAGKKP